MNEMMDLISIFGSLLSLQKFPMMAKEKKTG
jgi:hypothetical protein